MPDYREAGDWVLGSRGLGTGYLVPGSWAASLNISLRRGGQFSGLFDDQSGKCHIWGVRLKIGQITWKYPTRENEIWKYLICRSKRFSFLNILRITTLQYQNPMPSSQYPVSSSQCPASRHPVSRHPYDRTTWLPSKIPLRKLPPDSTPGSGSCPGSEPPGRDTLWNLQPHRLPDTASLLRKTSIPDW